MDVIRSLILASVLLGMAYTHSCEARPPLSREQRVEIMLGDTKVVVRVFGARNKGPLIVRVHENETTAKEVGLRAVKELNARFVDIEHGGGRDIHFVLGGKEYGIDPNRIFSEKGIAATLRTVGKADSAEARAAARKLADAIMTACGRSGPIIALHNNAGGVDRRGRSRYGLSWYERGGPLHLGMYSEVARMNGDEQRFVVVTDRDSFEVLSEMGQNVVFQDPAHDIDDGSMSSFAGSRHRPYFNIEAAFQDTEGQWKSLEAVLALYERWDE